MLGIGVLNPNIAPVYVGWRHPKKFPLVSGVLRVTRVGDDVRVVLDKKKHGIVIKSKTKSR
jgi:hypothetical protein